MAVSAMIPHQRPASDCPDAVLLHLRNTQAAHGDDPIGRAAPASPSRTGKLKVT